MNKKLEIFLVSIKYFSWIFKFIMITFYLNRNFFHEISLYKFAQNVTLISLLGTYFMLISLYDRHRYLSKGKFFNKKFLQEI